MRYSASFTVNKVFRAALLIVMFLFLAGLLATYLRWVKNYESAKGFIPLFNLDGEFNMPAFFSAALIATNAVLLSLIAKHKATEVYWKKHWRILSYVFVYLSMDELAGIHERLGGFAHSVAPNVLNVSGSRYWFLPIGILLILFAIYFFRFFWSLSIKTRIKFATAGMIYIMGAAGVEYLGDLYIAYNLSGDIYYSFLACFEEVLEMTGMILFLRALLIHLQTLSHTKYFHLQFLIGDADKSNGLVTSARLEETAQEIK